MDNLLEEFLIESHENLDQLDQNLVTLEEEPANREMLSRIFRTIHTLKGSCGFLGFTRLESVTHVGESLLSRLRDGDLQLNAEMTTALLALVDAVRQMLANIEVTGREGDADYARLIETLTRLQQGGVAVESSVAVAAAEEPAVSPAAGIGGDAMDVRLDSTPPQDKRGHGFNGGLEQRVETFLIESYEHLDQCEQALMAFETEPSHAEGPEMLSRISHAMQSLREACRLLGFARLESIARVRANVLSRLHNGDLRLNTETVATLLAMTDSVRLILSSIEVTGREGDADDAHLMATLTRLQQSEVPGENGAPSAAGEASPPLSTNGAGGGATVPSAPAAPQNGRQQPPSEVEPRAIVDATEPLQAARPPNVSDTGIRVDVGLLDALMDQVGELVLARNRIMQFATLQEDRNILAAYQRLDLITAELQENVMKTRMQPIGTIWNKFPRVVRDLALACGKTVNVSMDGQETELDRTLLEAIKDPLTHLVRNAIDHGIETPEARLQAGKPEAGTLLLRAFHEGGLVNIEIADDGGGIDPQRVAQKAIDRNLITAQQCDQMSPREILNLIFTPGFSTAETITSVSGRGVGMDVVKNNIEQINGTIDIQSQVGRGTTIKVKIPLTLAIIPALIVQCGGDRYAIPQASLVELVRLHGDDAHKKIETLYGAPVYRLRGNLLPLVFLNRELQLPGHTLPDGPGDDGAPTFDIVVLQVDERLFGLVVEGVNDTEEIVVKPLGRQLQGIPVFAGATIMGDGQVALILDVLGLAQRAHVISERRQATRIDAAVQTQEQGGELQTLLLIESAAGERLALPLSRVTRLEKIRRAQVEHVGHREVVQYWEQIMPLIDISQTLAGQVGLPTNGRGEAAETDTLNVVVYTNGERYVGLVIDHILDVVDGTFTVRGASSRAGVSGTVVVQGQVAELLDPDPLIQIADPAFFDRLPSAGAVG